MRESGGFDRERLRDKLATLAARGVYIGGSSWKYEGWLDQIYSRSRYRVRGRFSKKLFEDTCLSEYASIFPAVCGDFAFYQFPSDALWSKLFRQTPGGFRWGLKAPEQIVAPQWPVHARYGALAGLENHTFLDTTLFNQAFLRPLEPYREQVGVVILEFNAVRARGIADAAEFVKRLDPFLAALPREWRFAVELRSPDFLAPRLFRLPPARTMYRMSITRGPRCRRCGIKMAIKGSRTADMIVAKSTYCDRGVRTRRRFGNLRRIRASRK